MIAEQGTLTDITPLSLWLDIFERERTGILSLQHDKVQKVFYLNRGRISWAISSDEEDRIERILLARELASPEALAPFLSGNLIAESFGRVLVEESVISLETLIQAFREQVRQIAVSTLEWGAGRYQFSQETPPTRLVSLDVEIPALISHFMLTRMDIDVIWEELGRLGGPLQQSAHAGRSEHFAISAEQQETLSRFRHPQSINALLAATADERKQQVLRIVYFLLRIGLLEAQAAAQPSAVDFAELDSMLGQAPAAGSDDLDIDMSPVIDESAIQEIPLEPPSAAAKNRDEELRELPDLAGMEAAAPKPEDTPVPRPVQRPAPAAEARLPRKRPAPQPFAVPEKHRSRWLSVPFLAIVLVAVLAAAFLWLSRSRGPAPAPPETQAQERPATPKRRPARPRPAAAATPGQAGTPAAAGEEKQPDPTPAQNAASEEERARERFAAGDFAAAGDLWRAAAIQQQAKFTILLELDCLKESVLNAFQQFPPQERNGLFLLNRTSRDGRSCWLVLWGRFRTVGEAELALPLVPDYFKAQSSPPSVVELAPYL